MNAQPKDGEPTTAEPTTAEPTTAEPELGVVLHSRGYLVLLLVAAVVGIPISVLAFGFLAGIHGLENLVWDSVPTSLGFDEPPDWWPILTLGIAGVLVAIVVAYLPGRGGHVPALGLAGGATMPRELPGVVLAAAASLSLGAVVGPEAPLIALGGGLAVLAISRTKAAGNPQATPVLAAAGACAAISTIFGNPLVAAVMFLEVVGLARRQALLVILPCLVSSGVGALVFTGLGDWTGVEIGALSIPGLPSAKLVAVDLVWALPVAAMVALATWCAFAVGNRVATAAASRTVPVTVLAGLAAGALAALYAVVTGHSPQDVASSGEQTLGTLASQPTSWSTGALLLLLACKGLAYALCLGVFRGGPTFPALFIGGAFGVLAAFLFPHIGTLPGLAIGMAAGMAVTKLPVTSVVLVVLLLGDAAVDLMPVIILSTVTALVIGELLTTRRPATAAG